MTPEQAVALRASFSSEQIGKLPRAGIQLDYVGHAAVTDRLLAVDPEWSWEPVAFDEDGGPLIRRDAKNATLWIRLTVAGVTRYGVGLVAADAFELEKQLISDALRNGAMRFGVALDLWSRQDLHDVASEPPPVPPRPKLPDRVATLPDDQSARFKSWKDDQGFPFPWPPDAVEAMHAKLDDLEMEPF